MSNSAVIVRCLHTCCNMSDLLPFYHQVYNILSALLIFFHFHFMIYFSVCACVLCRAVLVCPVSILPLCVCSL